jgi:trimeric autotransporter adhesin
MFQPCRSRFAAVFAALITLSSSSLLNAQTATSTSLSMSSITGSLQSGGTLDWGNVLTLSASVTAGQNPVTRGLVNFCDTAASNCTDAHVVGSAQLTSASTAVFKFHPGIGSHSYKAVFVGTKTNAASSSAAQTLNVPTPTGQSPAAVLLTSTGTWQRSSWL